MLDEGNFSLHGKSISGSQHVEGGGSAARCSLGGIGYDKLALQVATTRHGNTHPVDEPHGSGGEPHGSMSTNKANDWACPIAEEPIPDDFKYYDVDAKCLLSGFFCFC